MGNTALPVDLFVDTLPHSPSPHPPPQIPDTATTMHFFHRLCAARSAVSLSDQIVPNIKRGKEKKHLHAIMAIEKGRTSSPVAAMPSKPAKQARLDGFFTPLSSCQRREPPTNDATHHETPPEPTLSDEQTAILNMVLRDKKSIFFTGSAGTGKSLLLRAIIAALRQKYAKTPDHLAVCASTGLAAQNIGGTTIHAWGAVTPGMHDIGKLVSFIKTCRPAHRRWKVVKVLIIDEISMVDGRLFDTLAALACELRKRKKVAPFGGIQLVVTGDFFQLPPVTRAGEDVFFAFQSQAWKECIEHTVTLSRVFRQRDDRFVTLLNEMRRGEISSTATQILASLSRPLPDQDGLLPTELFPLRVEVDRANTARMAALPGSVHRFLARDSGPAPPEKRRRLLDNMFAVATLDLKRDAQVMLVKNVSETLVNGSVGRVLGFCPEPCTAAVKNKKMDRAESEMLPLVEFDTFKGKQKMLVTRDEFRAEDSEGNLLARRVQIPLVLAWALSIHKAQGQTIQRVKVDLNKVFEKGQSYVALSRAASLDGLQVLGFDAKKVAAHPRVLEWSKTPEE